MDIVIENAKRFVRNHFEGGISPHEQIINETKTFIDDIDNPLDKIKFLNFILVRNNSDFETHKLTCKEVPEVCFSGIKYETLPII